MIDLVELVGSSVVLTPTGRETGSLKGICPWCRALALTVHPGRQLWHCFACSLGGDAQGWLRRFVKGETT